MTRYSLASRLPDINLDPPDEQTPDDWDAMTREQQVQALCDDFTAQELAAMYLDAIGERSK